MNYFNAVSHEHIFKNIKKLSFLGIMSDNTTDISTKTQIVLVFCYELNGRDFERFWVFSNPEDGARLSESILRQINPILRNWPQKLIAQTYDGAAVMSGHLAGVKIKEVYKNAHFVCYYAHQLNKLLEQAVSSTPSVRIFLFNLNFFYIPQSERQLRNKFATKKFQDHVLHVGIPVLKSS